MNLDIIMSIVRTLETAAEVANDETLPRSQSYWRSLCRACAAELAEQVDKERAAREQEATCLR